VGKLIRLLPERFLLSFGAVKLNAVDKSYLLSGVATACLEHGRAQSALKLFMMSLEEILETPVLSVSQLCDIAPLKVNQGLGFHLAELLTMNICGLIKIKTYEHRFEEVDQLRTLSRSLSMYVLGQLKNSSDTTMEDLAQLTLLWSSLVPDPSLHDDEVARRIIKKDQEQIILVGKRLVECLEQKATAGSKEKDSFEKYRNFSHTLASILRICSRYPEADELLRRVDETTKRLDAL